MDTILSVPLQKRLSYTGTFQNHRLKAGESSKGWKCITVLPKIIEKNISGSFERKPQIYKIGKTSLGKKRTSKKMTTFNH